MDEGAEADGAECEEGELKVALLEAKPSGPCEEERRGSNEDRDGSGGSIEGKSACEERGSGDDNEQERGGEGSDGVGSGEEKEFVDDGERKRLVEDGELLEECRGMEELELRREVEQVGEVAVDDCMAGDVRAEVAGAVEAENRGEEHRKRRVDGDVKGGRTRYAG